MIIFGMKGKKTKLDEGEFYCPICGGQRHYHHIQVRRYLSLYFIPVVPLDHQGEFVECQTCGKTFAMEVLTLKAPPPKSRSLAEIINALPNDLLNGLPLDYAMRDLTQAGLSYDAAKAALAPFPPAHTCPDCGLGYVAGVSTCGVCGKGFTAP